MPGPRWLARFNRRFTNRLLIRVVPVLPNFAVVRHSGRRSGRAYRTPINAFRNGDRFVMALTYGPRTEWVQNVLASGGCALEWRGTVIRLDRPRLVRDPRKQLVPPLVRIPLSVLRVNDFLELSVADPASRPAQQSLNVRGEP